MHYIKDNNNNNPIDNWIPFSGVLWVAVQSVPEWWRRARGGGGGGGGGGPGQDGGHHAGHPPGGGHQDLLPPHVISALSMSADWNNIISLCKALLIIIYSEWWKRRIVFLFLFTPSTHQSVLAPLDECGHYDRYYTQLLLSPSTDPWYKAKTLPQTISTGYGIIHHVT